MSDEASTAPTRSPSILFEHWCERPGCKEWGMLGCQITKGQSTYWCWEHFPDKEWLAARKAERIARGG